MAINCRSPSRSGTLAAPASPSAFSRSTTGFSIFGQRTSSLQINEFSSIVLGFQAQALSFLLQDPAFLLGLGGYLFDRVEVGDVDRVGGAGR
jgi:hypothetical protein